LNVVTFGLAVEAHGNRVYLELCRSVTCH